MIARASWYCSVWKITTTRGSPTRRRSVRTSRRAWRAATASPTPSGIRAKAP